MPLPYEKLIVKVMIFGLQPTANGPLDGLPAPSQSTHSQPTVNPQSTLQSTHSQPLEKCMKSCMSVYQEDKNSQLFGIELPGMHDFLHFSKG